jgi:predicted  nucleic acid-binding Zn-ribbon protein
LANYKDAYEKLTSERRAQFDQIQKLQDSLRTAKAMAEERARRRIREEVAELEAARNHVVREAHAQYEAWLKNPVGPAVGLATADIKRAMGTKDHVTVTSIWEEN